MREVLLKRLENKVAVVTCAGSGLNSEITEIIIMAGAKETVKTINAAGGEALALKTNVTAEEDVQRMNDKAVLN